MNPRQIFRRSLLAATGFLIGLLILAIAPTLLRQTAFDHQRNILDRVRLIAPQEEEILETEEVEKEPEEPPDPDPTPPPEMEPPTLEMPEIETPQMTYESASVDYTNTVSLPSLTGLGLKGIKINPQNYARKQGKALLPGLPQHGPPKTRFNSDEVDKTPQPVATTQPLYPYKAKRLGIEGMVRFRFLVDTSGKTSLLEILESKPPGEFDQAVRRSVKNWRFKPGTKDGRAVETWVKTTVQFKLE
ncbi:MAG: hypothetical protein CSB23_00180 [Deltaproteobacteria bacterium]|nr:MAG: hypothetical protein CSB23_00180 [Deltaproteobacteria bacterium]